MKCDMDLVRAIGLAIEAAPNGYAPEPLEIPGRTEEEIGYHVHIMSEAGLIIAHDVTSIGDPSPRGHGVEPHVGRP